MNKFPFAAMVLMLLSGVCFIIFIVANHAFDDPDIGLFTKLNESMQKTTSTKYQNWFSERLDHIRTGFGLSALVLFLISIVVAIATGFKRVDAE